MISIAHSKISLSVLLSVLSIFSLQACGEGTRIVSGSDYDTQSQLGGQTTTGLDYRDFENAARNAVESFLNSPFSEHPEEGRRWVLAISRIVNDTTLTLDTDQLVKKMRVAFLQSGRVLTTTAVGAGGPEDQLTSQVRDLASSDLFNPDTVARARTVVAPDLSLSGKIIQRINIVDDEQQIDYYFQLSITNLDTGLAYWEFEEIIAKLSDGDSFIW